MIAKVLDMAQPTINEKGTIAIKLRKIFVFTTWNRKALPPLYGTNVSVFKKCKILNLMAMKGDF